MQAEGRGKGSRPGPPLLMIVRTLPVSHLSTLPFPAYHTPPSPQLAAVQHNPKTKTPSTQLAAAQHKQRLLSTVLQELTRTSAEAGGGSASSGPAVSDRLLAQLAARGETLCHLLSAVDSLSEALGSYTEGVACAHAACRLSAERAAVKVGEGGPGELTGGGGRAPMRPAGWVQYTCIRVYGDTICMP